MIKIAIALTTVMLKETRHYENDIKEFIFPDRFRASIVTLGHYELSPWYHFRIPNVLNSLPLKYTLNREDRIIVGVASVLKFGG